MGLPPRTSVTPHPARATPRSSDPGRLALASLLHTISYMAAASDSLLRVGDDTGLIEAPARARKSVRRPARKPARGKQKSRAPRGGSVAPWVVTMVVAAAAGFAGYYQFDSMQAKKQELSEIQSELVTARKHVADAEDRALESAAELGRTKDKLSGLQDKIEEKAAAADELATRLEELVGKEGELKRGANGELTLQLMDKVLFRFGEAELTVKGRAVLSKLGEALQKFPDKQVWVQGHTDDVPIGKDNTTFASNWELSAVRALNVVHFLQDEVKVNPRRLAAVAFSEYHPVSRRRAKNRRIEIVLAPKEVRLVHQ